MLSLIPICVVCLNTHWVLHTGHADVVVVDFLESADSIWSDFDPRASVHVRQMHVLKRDIVVPNFATVATHVQPMSTTNLAVLDEYMLAIGGLNAVVTILDIKMMRMNVGAFAETKTIRVRGVYGRVQLQIINFYDVRAVETHMSCG